MTQNFDVNKTFKGKNGQVWVNDVLVGSCDSGEIKVSPEYEPQKIGGKEYQTVEGYTVSGSISRVKMDSMFAKLLADDIKKGVLTDVNIIIKTTNGEIEERVQAIGVAFDDLVLGAFKNGESTKEEVSFKAVDYEILD